MKKILISALFTIFSLSLMAQRLEVKHLDENDKVTETEYYEVGDVIVLAHKKEGKKVHLFEGKVTGILLDKGTIRVFDYARSERVVSIVGKKIKVSEIVGVKRPSQEEIQKRQNQAVASSAAGAFGAALGGNIGSAIAVGSAVAGIGMDLASRDAVSQQHIQCQILEF